VSALFAAHIDGLSLAVIIIIIMIPSLYVSIITHAFQAEEEDASLSWLRQPLKNFHVSIVTNPFLAVARHNKKHSAATDLQDAAPWCYATLIVGPFYTMELACAFTHEISHGTRGLDSMADALYQLLLVEGWAAAHNLEIHDSDLMPEQGLRQLLLEHHAPEEYLQALDVVEEATRTLLSSPCVL
jgi:hypothetical protein